MPSIERKLQLSLNTLNIWADTNGFRFSKSKTVCIHFCNKRNLHPDPILLLNGQTIPVVDKTKFLGIYFDRKLNFKDHIQYLRDKCLKALNILKIVSRLDWGADRKVLLRLYRALIRSRLDYSAPIYGSARPSYLKRLEPIQNQGLRLCLGAYRTSPSTSLHVEADESPLDIRRKLLSLHFILRVYANPDNPVYDNILTNEYETLYTSKPSAIKPLKLRVAYEIEAICPHPNDVHLGQILSPFWLLRSPEIDLTLTHFKKNSINPMQFKNDFCDLLEHYPGTRVFYTDGSKCENGVACASVSDNFQIQMRLPDSASIYTAELMAILYTLDFILSCENDEFIIVCDSLSSIEAIGHFQISNPIVFRILQKVTTLHKLDKNLILIWCPSHCGIQGNEVADKLAKQALSYSITNFRLPYTDFKTNIRSYCRSQWQSIWDNENRNKLYNIQPELGLWPQCFREKRREEIVLARCRIGHTHLTHTHLLRKELPPVCVACFCPLTVKHILVECIDFSPVRQQFYNVSSMKDLFMNTDSTKIISFLQAVGLFYRF
jgi:ribonuclease HI